MKITILKSRDWNEYRVPSPDGREAGSYYTDDKEDATDTARDMYRRMGKGEIEIHFKSVDDWPEHLINKNPPDIHIDIDSHNVKENPVQDIGKHLSAGFYKITAKRAGMLAKPFGGLPKHGYEKKIIFEGEEWWLSRTPDMGKVVWSIRRANYKPVYNLSNIYRENPNNELVEIYRHIHEIKAEKADGKLYKHPFTKGSRIYGLPDGSLLIKSDKGKRLWKQFLKDGK